jgi:hypothetical protein
MQAGGGGRRKLSVVSSQFLVKGGKRFFCGGLGKLRLGRKDGLGELFTAPGFEGMLNPAMDARQPYRGAPTKFHLPQVKDSCSGRK